MAIINEVKSNTATNDKDAERYRWLRKQIKLQRLVIAESCGWDGLKSWSGDDPDKYIDDAMTGQESL